MLAAQNPSAQENPKIKGSVAVVVVVVVSNRDGVHFLTESKRQLVCLSPVEQCVVSICDFLGTE